MDNKDLKDRIPTLQKEYAVLRANIPSHLPSDDKCHDKRCEIFRARKAYMISLLAGTGP